MSDKFKLGISEIDITPPVGTYLAGGLDPRPSEGIQDPLLIKTGVFESAGTRLLVAAFDLCVLPRNIGDKCVEMASQRTGIPTSHIIWSCTHSHTSPYTAGDFPHGNEACINREWLDSLPIRFAEGAVQAVASLAPARISHARTYCSNVSHNRRLHYKDGRDINTWLLNRGEDECQCIGAAEPIDPEYNLLAFDNEDGSLRCVIANFALHVNNNFGSCISADYPAVIASRLRERFGQQVTTIFLPGMCGDINPIQHWRQTGDILGEAAIHALENRKPWAGPVKIGAVKREITVPIRPLDTPQEERISRSQWQPEFQEYFRISLELMRKRNIKERKTWLSAWHIGDISFAGMPGEVFVEYGFRLKQKGPYPWTIPVELCCDWTGYLVTRKAWEAGGYESLISDIAPVSVEGVEMMEKGLLEMLEELKQK